MVPLKSTTTVVHYPRMSREDPQFKLRMPLELKARIEQAAKDSRRSLNAEIVARLEESFVEPEKYALTTRIRREALSEEEAEQAPDSEATHKLTDQQLWDVINEVLDSVTGRERRQARQTKGPTPRSKFPKK